MSGTLYLCATPIGNLEDMTFRVIRTLKEVDLIAAEDTRNSIKLLNHFEIQTPMTSYHEYNKYEKGRKLVEKLQDGMNIALITDAGTPGISDPGEELVKMCYEAGISVTSLPGAAACITALTLSGLSTRRFAFEAFLPTDKKEKELVLQEIERETRTIIMYEAVGVLPFLASCEAVHGTDLVETTEYVMGDYTSAYAIPLNCDGNTGLTAVFDADGNLMNICSSDDFDQYISSFPNGASE